jgi:hypothetical protein
MECPICGYDMTVKSTRTTSDSWGRKSYDWTKYRCERDDVSAEVEVPKKDEE